MKFTSYINRCPAFCFPSGTCGFSLTLGFHQEFSTLNFVWTNVSCLKLFVLVAQRPWLPEQPLLIHTVLSLPRGFSSTGKQGSAGELCGAARVFGLRGLLGHAAGQAQVPGVPGAASLICQYSMFSWINIDRRDTLSYSSLSYCAAGMNSPPWREGLC